MPCVVLVGHGIGDAPLAGSEGILEGTWTIIPCGNDGGNDGRTGSRARGNGSRGSRGGRGGLWGIAGIAAFIACGGELTQAIHGVAFGRGVAAISIAQASEVTAIEDGAGASGFAGRGRLRGIEYRVLDAGTVPPSVVKTHLSRATVGIDSTRSGVLTETLIGPRKGGE
jgi:hypothetical protein